MSYSNNNSLQELSQLLYITDCDSNVDSDCSTPYISDSFIISIFITCLLVIFLVLRNHHDLY